MGSLPSEKFGNVVVEDIMLQSELHGIHIPGVTGMFNKFRLLCWRVEDTDRIAFMKSALHMIVVYENAGTPKVQLSGHGLSRDSQIKQKNPSQNKQKRKSAPIGHR
jgi:hypothetical protein